MNAKNNSTQNISLTGFERQIVERVSDERGLYNFSATVRQIIREWAQEHNVQPQPNPVNGMVAELRAELSETE